MGNQPEGCTSIEVPVTIERPAGHNIFTAKPDKLTPVEIRSLDNSPPQRRSPSFKSRLLSPAEQNTVTNHNTLVDGHLDAGSSEVSLILREYNFADRGPVKNTNYELGAASNQRRSLDVSDSLSSDSDITLESGSQTTMHVVQMAAKKLENVAQSSEYDRTRSGMCSNGEIENGYRGHHRLPRWADKACQEIKYIDDDTDERTDMYQEQSYKDAVYCRGGELSAREIMKSTQMLAELDLNRTTTSVVTPSTPISTTSVLSQVHSPLPSFEPQKKRVILANPPEPKQRSKLKEMKEITLNTIRNSRCIEIARGDRTAHGSNLSIDDIPRSNNSTPRSSRPNSPVLNNSVSLENNKRDMRRGSLELRHMDRIINDISTSQSASLPTSPVHKVVQPKQKRTQSKTDLSKACRKLSSPRSRRKMKNKQTVDSSDDEVALSGDEITTSENYKNLETFQKAQLNRKVSHSDTNLLI